MKFITEMELRDLYKTGPFETYVLEPDTKITPGARQFLVDRRVALVQAQGSDSKTSKIDETSQTQVRENWCTLRLLGKMECIESLFILTATEFSHTGEAALSEEVMTLGKYFRNVRNAERKQIVPDNLQFWGLTAEEIKTRAENLKQSIDISEFYLGLENGKEIALLNHLRASLGEVEPALLETYWDEEKQICSRQDLIDRVNLIINILCIIMWKFSGGRKWKM
ncbi:cobalamin adenosyltransferase [Desulfosporosinus shakirovi]|uniref:cobalamin adenosyltransferase n=1 Tax=Desulfosporosinus shakirovi TaxID=2885154 RepID=UPI001E53A7F7|nr:cobalamin adenosyltransferase [Desulfosporosinus sp. SRJS8]MCB8817778.1 cobalamin adenosyltransferase [Desulfosporosinus sp. SRJS8]